MTSPSPAERPDLYDFFDSYNGPPPTVDYLMQVIPDEVKALMEARQGRPFAEIAQMIASGKTAHDESSQAIGS